MLFATYTTTIQLTYPIYCLCVLDETTTTNGKWQININTHISPGTLGSGSSEEPKSVVQMTRRAYMYKIYCVFDAGGCRVPILIQSRILWAPTPTNTDPCSPNKTHGEYYYYYLLNRKVQQTMQC